MFDPNPGEKKTSLYFGIVINNELHITVSVL